MASHKLKMRESFIEQYIKFLSFLETEIKYSLEPLPSILSKASNNGMISCVINECIDALDNGKDLNSAWNSSIFSIPNYYGLNNDDIELLRAFGDNLGSTDTNNQISNCRLNIELISNKLKNAREERIQKSKLYMMLGIFSGLSLSLLLI